MTRFELRQALRAAIATRRVVRLDLGDEVPHGIVEEIDERWDERDLDTGEFRAPVALVAVSPHHLEEIDLRRIVRVDLGGTR